MRAVILLVAALVLATLSEVSLLVFGMVAGRILWKDVACSSSGSTRGPARTEEGQGE